MKLLMMSMLLLNFLSVICSGRRTAPGRRTTFQSSGQFRRICQEIADLKKADEDLKKANEELKKANEDLITANEDLQNRIIAIEGSSNAAVDGHWTGWLSWSGCYDIDGTGQKTRQRLCLDPRLSNGGTDCVGIDTEQMECELPAVDGNWTGWLSWSGCYDVDGTDQKTRQRLCLDPRPSNGGTDCVGIDTEQMECGEEFKSAFAVSGEDPISPDANPAGVIAWPSTAIKTNIGGNYDPATGLYTAPYDGTYSFHANIYKNQGAGDGVFCSIVRGDGTTLAFANVPSILGFLVGTGSTIVHLDQGDTVVLGCTNVNYVNGFSSWMGYPVMAD